MLIPFGALQLINKELAMDKPDHTRQLLGLNPQARWQVGRDRQYNYAGLIILVGSKLHEFVNTHGRHLKYACDATPYNLGQEAFQGIFAGGSPLYLDTIALDGLPIVELTLFRYPAPLTIVSTAASKDGRILANTVESHFEVFDIETPDCDRLESDKGCENSGNDFDFGLGESGLYALLFHPSGVSSFVFLFLSLSPSC